MRFPRLFRRLACFFGYVWRPVTGATSPAEVPAGRFRALWGYRIDARTAWELACLGEDD